MEYSKELIGLLESNKNILALWLNKDATEWHTREVAGFEKTNRGDILKEKSIPKIVPPTDNHNGQPQRTSTASLKK